MNFSSEPTKARKMIEKKVKKLKENKIVNTDPKSSHSEDEKKYFRRGVGHVLLETHLRARVRRVFLQKSKDWRRVVQDYQRVCTPEKVFVKHLNVENLK